MQGRCPRTLAGQGRRGCRRWCSRLRSGRLSSRRGRGSAASSRTSGRCRRGEIGRSSECSPGVRRPRAGRPSSRPDPHRESTFCDRCRPCSTWSIPGRRVDGCHVDSLCGKPNGEGACTAADVDDPPRAELIQNREVRVQIVAVTIEYVVESDQPRVLEDRVRHGVTLARGPGDRGSGTTRPLWVPRVDEP